VKDDRRLVREYIAGSDAAFEMLFDRHSPSLYAFACHLTGRQQDAEDLCQSTWIEAIKSLGRYRGRGSFRAWLHAIALHLHRDLLRRRRAEVGPLDVEMTPADTDANPERLADRLDLVTSVRAALAALSPEHRTVLLLHELQGFKYREIAALLDCPIGTVKSRLHYAIAAMRAALRDVQAEEVAGA